MIAITAETASHRYATTYIPTGAYNDAPVWMRLQDSGSFKPNSLNRVAGNSAMFGDSQFYWGNVNIYRPGDFAQNQYVDDNSNKEYAIHWLHDETANFAFSDGRVENVKFVARKIFSANWQLL